MCTLLATAVARAQGTPAHAEGTYEITWFSVSAATEQPTIARLLLVLSPTVLPDSIRARLKPGHGRYDTHGPTRACWRITEGSAVMNSGRTTGTWTDWSTIGADSVSITLWFLTDAGSKLRFRLVGDSVRGQISSSGFLNWPSGFESRVVRDSVIGTRVGKPDIGRCLP